MATKKIGVAGKFGSKYGATIKERYKEVASKQAKKQQCPYCKKYKSKRLAKGLWRCKSCGKKFTAHAYYLKTL